MARIWSGTLLPDESFGCIVNRMTLICSRVAQLILRRASGYEGQENTPAGIQKPLASDASVRRHTLPFLENKGAEIGGSMGRNAVLHR